MRGWSRVENGEFCPWPTCCRRITHEYHLEGIHVLFCDRHVEMLIHELRMLSSVIKTEEAGDER